MNYNNTLIKRKEYFGLIWLAAHHPSKLSKPEIVRMDLSQKCKEISEYIANGITKKPRFNLLVLSHLMYGLVVILNKKNTYLYNELVTLKGMLSITFYTTEVKKKTKQVKTVKAADKSAITLKENLPDVFDEFSLATMELDKELELMNLPEINMQERYKKITLDDTEDIINRSTMIPIDYNYEMDQLGDQGLSLMYDIEERQLLESTTKGSTQKAAHLSKIKKVIERTPFRDLTNEPGLPMAREEEPSRIAYADETTIMQEAVTEINKETIAESVLSQITNDFGMPQLFQETLLQETLAQPEQLPEQPAFTSQIEEVEFPGEQRLPRSISVEIKQLKEDKSKKIAAREVAKERAVFRKKKLLVDTVTEISKNELRDRMAPTTLNEEELALEQTKFFREKNTWLVTKNDYLLSDIQLFKAPFNQDARRTDLAMNDYTLFQRHSARNQLVINSKLLTSSKVKDDTFSYLTESRERARELEAAQEIQQQEPEQQEIQRRRESYSREFEEHTSITKTATSAKKRISTRESLNAKQVEMQIEQQQTYQMSAAEMTLQPMEPLDTFADQTMMPPPILPEIQPEIQPEVQPVEIPVEVQPVEMGPDLDDYEELIINSLKSVEFEFCILQDLIRESTLTKRALQAQKPRKYFAAKMFSAALNLCKQVKIQVNQDIQFDPIYVSLVEN